MQFQKIIGHGYPQIQPVAVFNSLRTLSTSQLFNHNRPRYREAKVTVNEKSKTRRNAARELLIKTNRNAWEREMGQLEILKGRIPTSDIYLVSEFEPKKYSLSEAVEMLRESAQPDMYDCMGNAVIAKVTLNMCTKKKTKFIPKFECHVVLPNLLTFMPKCRVLAICPDSDNPEDYLNAGALYAGGSNLIKLIEQGQYHWEQYDTVVAHQSWETRLLKLRNILKERSPTIKNGRLGEDMINLCSTYSNGTKLASSSTEGIPEVAFLNLILGQLSWDVSQLEENLRSYLQCIESQKSSRIQGDFITSGEIHCPPTGERFLLNISNYYSPTEHNVKKHLKTHDTEDDDDVESNPVVAERQQEELRV